MKNSIKKNFFWNMIGTTFNAFNSLFFLVLVTRINGVDDAGIFTFSFSTACLLYVVGIYAGRTYQVSDTSKKFNDSDYLYNRILSCILAIVLGFIFVFIKDYSLYKIYIFMLLVLFKVIEAFSEVIYAIIQKNNELHIVGKSLFIKAIIGLVSFAMISIITKNLILSCVGLVLANILVLLLYDLQKMKTMKHIKTALNMSKVFGIFRSGFFIFSFTFLSLYVINAPRYAIDNLLGNSAQTIFGIIIMPATIMILFGQFFIHPFLLRLTETWNLKKLEHFKKNLISMVLGLAVIGLLATFVAYIVGIPFLELIYGVNLDSYLIPLILIIVGSTLYAISTIISSALTTMRYTLIQFVIGLFTCIIAYFGSNLFVSYYQITGASLAYLLIMALQLLMYFGALLYYLKKEGSDK